MYVSNILPKDKIFYFCKDCEKLVEVKPVGKKFAYICSICNTKNVAFGTEKSLKNFYRIKDPGQTMPHMTEEEKRAMKADKF